MIAAIARAFILILLGHFNSKVLSFTSYNSFYFPSQHSSTLLEYRNGESSESSITAESFIVEIESPDSFKKFIDQDDTTAVIKVYAEWCKTCKQMDLHYKKIAKTWGERSSKSINEFNGMARFAQMEYHSNRELCQTLDVTKVPYILIYKSRAGKIDGFVCPPGRVQLLIDTLHKYALNPHQLQNSELSILENVKTQTEIDVKLDFLQEASLSGSMVNGEFFFDLPAAQTGKKPTELTFSFEEFCKQHTLCTHTNDAYAASITPEMAIEKVLSEGSALMGSIIPEIQKELGYRCESNDSPFEYFCKHHTHQRIDSHN